MKPTDLSIHGAAAELLSSLRAHPVVVVQGATGCGKTTQIPQILCDSDLISPDALVGVTQPRRIAATSVAWRIAQERGQPELHGDTSYAIRFDDRTTASTRIKVMTDGILLQEARTDPDLSRYGVIMVDEAHERSLNIDFTLGLLKDLLRRRGDLRVIVSSATINAGVFTTFFDGAPLITAQAHAWPIDVRYRPITADAGPDRTMEVASVLADLHRGGAQGDMLVFLTGEGEIKFVISELERRRLRDIQVMPLYGRLTREEQERVFEPCPGRRKVVLATNIAETSLTIDGVSTVVDLGLAKVPRYDPRSGFPSLRESPISQASARQRAGRAGRTAPGVCVRLYSRQDLAERREFPTEDIRRMDLSEVVLRLIDLGIGDVERFEFITRPTRAALRNAIHDLIDLDAIDESRKLTDFGRRMVPFPLPPRLACMVVEAAERYSDVFEEVLTACALLSVRWPQILPAGEEDEARAAHRNFADPHGDLAAGLRMIRAFERTKNRDRFCERHYLDLRLMKELLLVREQLRDIARAAGLTGQSGGPFPRVIRCVARAFNFGICQRIGRTNQYETARGVRVSIHPGSCLWGQKPRFAVAADMVVTSRPWARAVSVLDVSDIPEIDPELARHWRIRPKGRRRGRRDAEPRPIPERVEIDLFDEIHPVKRRRGKPTISMSWESLQANAQVPLPPDLPEDLRVTVHHHGARILKSVPLRNAQRLAPHLQLDAAPVKAAHHGELFTPDRDLHHILRHLPDLLRQTIGRRRKKLAFLTLITNGAGGYWYDAAMDFALALDQARIALDALAKHPTLDDADRALLDRADARLTTAHEALTDQGPVAH